MPKGEDQTRLIFHLSYDFKQSGFKSVNHYTPEEYCKVKYKDLDYAIESCFYGGSHLNDTETVPIYFSKTDQQSAFRIVPLSRNCWHLLTMMAEDPETGKKFYFQDKCLPFGSSGFVLSVSETVQFSEASGRI